MNEGDIAEMFIRAAEIDRAIPEHVGPQQPRSLALPYVHDWLDKLGWGTKRLEEERREFWERLGLMPSSAELSEVEILRAWLLAVKDAGERRCLLAWARSKAGGMTFKRWCFKVEGIHPETGRRRKDRALSRINRELRGRTLQNNEMRVSGVLLDSPENGYISANIEDEREQPAHGLTWRDDPSMKLVNDPEFRDFSWAAKRNARRRQLAAKKAAEAGELKRSKAA
ncbi:hypothetical protein [Consotaella aegiceratis]|uniref:hypothetical protein n=1 Tax=Consotaella aegiceratis TaxID=3097961 RepID=UPI002F412306